MSAIGVDPRGMVREQAIAVLSLAKSITAYLRAGELPRFLMFVSSSVVLDYVSRDAITCKLRDQYNYAIVSAQ